jgi:hypothetical protein
MLLTEVDVMNADVKINTDGLSEGLKRLVAMWRARGISERLIKMALETPLIAGVL